ncbi:MAG TPA: Tim44-like domain-containing protein [Burkholderiaceae bacterium]|nr:Tim44-like domain-containing protein [Burkholderiaceae bacterium]
MKRFMALVAIGLFAATLATDADAQRRLGGGRSLGKQSPQVQQREATPPAPQQAPAQQAAPAQQSATAAGAAARPASPWRGALLGLAAGLGIAALASYLGFGETLTAILMAALVGVAVVAVIGFVLRRTRGATAQPAYGGFGGHGGGAYAPDPQPLPAPAPVRRTALDLAPSARPGSAMDEFARGANSGSTQPWGVPAGFDTQGFVEHAKQYFGKLQGAWDRGSLAELEEFTTRDMFVALTHELRARGAGSRTEVLTLDASLLGIESTAAEHLASVRFSGSLRVDGEVEQVDEVWNLTKPTDGSSGWLLAGIQQLS